MDPREVERVEHLLPQNGELRELWTRHREFEEQLNRLQAQRFLTPEEEIQRKELQKRKLAGKDRIQAILDRNR